MEKKSTHIAAFVLAAIVISTGTLYLMVASDEYNDYKQEADAATNEQGSESSEQESEEEVESGTFGPQHEAVFFGIIGAMYVPIGLWILKKKDQTKIPYIISLIGSAGLIVFYVATRTVDLPLVGLQTDIGIQDTLAKVLQGTIVAISGFMLFSIAKHRKVSKLA